MKKYIYICLLLSLAVLTTSCEKVLNKEPLDQFTNSNYWTSETNVEAYANAFYNDFVGYGNGGGSGIFYFNTLNDNQASSGFTLWRYSTVPASHSTWSSSYVEIRRANILIQNVEKMENLSDEAKANWIGVGRLYRAIQHYDLVRTFGDCIYVDKALDVTEDDKQAYLFAARTDRDEVMNKVLEDLNFACSNITYNASSRTAFNKYLANAIKAEICLYEGTFSKYRSSSDGQKAPDTGRASQFLQECKTACEVIMNNSAYVLDAKYHTKYNSVDLASNKEVIFYKKYLYGTLTHSTNAYTNSSTQQSGMTKDAFDAYLFTDGLPRSLTSLNNTDVPVVDGNGNYSIQHCLAVRDKRLSESIDPVLMFVGKGYVRYGVGMETTSSTGYGVLKFDNPDINVLYRDQSSSNDTDCPLYWLSEIYLNYAEACAELGSCTQADLNKSINQIRIRTGLPNLTTSPVHDPANNMGVSDLIWEIRRERRVELMYDKNDRYLSLIRWHQLDKLDNTAHPNILKGANVSGLTGLTVEVTSDGYINASRGQSRSYDAKHYLDPIPSGQRQLNENLSQNYGW